MEVSAPHGYRVGAASQGVGEWADGHDAPSYSWRMGSNGEGPRGDAESRRLNERVRELIESFDAHDRIGLAQLSREERAEQLQARAAIYRYTGWLYAQVKRRGLDPKYDPELAILGVYRNLTGALGDAAVEVSMEQRDEDHRPQG